MNTRALWRGASLAVVGLALLTSAASATTALELDTRAMTHTSEVVLVGEATTQRVEWQAGTLVTLVTVHVDEVLKGQTAPSVVVALPGGIDSQRRFPVAVTYAGAPTLAQGEEVVLFLEGGQIPGAYTIAGFSQGKYTIVETPTGQTKVTRNLDGLDLQSGDRIVKGGRTAQSLSELKAEIRGYVSETETSPRADR